MLTVEKEAPKMVLNEKLTATNGQTLDASIVFVAAFKHLQGLAERMLTVKMIEGIENKNIQWIITGPAIWNDAAKYKMRSWAIESGLVDPEIPNQCKIVYEPDCASIAVQHEIKERRERQKLSLLSAASNPITDDVDDDDDDEDDDEKTDLSLRKNEKYILVDAGGGTVDIACHEILGEFEVKEVLHPSGGPWGSCYIDDQFVELLHAIFSKEWVEEFKAKDPSKWVQTIDNFQTSKESFRGDQRKKHGHNVTLPVQLIGFMQDKLTATSSKSIHLAAAIAQKSVFGKNHKMKLSEQTLELDNVLWTNMFDHVLDPTISHIKSLLKEPKLMQNCKYLCLVGGLSTSPYFQNRMISEFGLQSKYRLNMIIPKRPILAVVRGAAYMGVTDNYIKARVLRYTYGETLLWPLANARQLGLSEDYIAGHKVESSIEDGVTEERIELFQVMARKNEEIQSGEVRISNGVRPSSKVARTTKRIMYSAMENPKVKSDGTVMGTITTTWKVGDKSDMEVILEFHFAETLIKAIVYRKAEPEKRKIRYIQSAM